MHNHYVDNDIIILQYASQFALCYNTIIELCIRASYSYEVHYANVVIKMI